MNRDGGTEEKKRKRERDKEIEMSAMMSFLSPHRLRPDEKAGEFFFRAIIFSRTVFSGAKSRLKKITALASLSTTTTTSATLRRSAMLESDENAIPL